jgi:hypothetical protein
VSIISRLSRKSGAVQDRLLILGARHWEQALREYVAHYNAARPHRALE